MELAQLNLHFVNLLTIDGISATIGLDALILQSVESKDCRGRCLELKRNRLGRIDFHWSLSVLEWWSNVDMVDALIEGGSPAHQYLNEDKEGIDDAIVELAYRESLAYRGLE